MSVGPAAARLAPAAALLLTVACSGPPSSAAVPPPPTQAVAAPTRAPAVDGLPGMPPVTDPHDVYAAVGAGMLSAAARAAKPLVYVPHTKSRDVWVIDPSSFAVVARYPLGRGELQHVVPAWDMKTLYASDDKGDRLTPFDPTTARRGRRSR